MGIRLGRSLVAVVLVVFLCVTPSACSDDADEFSKYSDDLEHQFMEIISGAGGPTTTSKPTKRSRTKRPKNPTSRLPTSQKGTHTSIPKRTAQPTKRKSTTRKLTKASTSPPKPTKKPGSRPATQKPATIKPTVKPTTSQPTKATAGRPTTKSSLRGSLINKFTKASIKTINPPTTKRVTAAPSSTNPPSTVRSPTGCFEERCKFIDVFFVVEQNIFGTQWDTISRELNSRVLAKGNYHVGIVAFSGHRGEQAEDPWGEKNGGFAFLVSPLTFNRTLLDARALSYRSTIASRSTSTPVALGTGLQLAHRLLSVSPYGERKQIVVITSRDTTRGESISDVLALVRRYAQVTLIVGASNPSQLYTPTLFSEQAGDRIFTSTAPSSALSSVFSRLEAVCPFLKPELCLLGVKPMGCDRGAHCVANSGKCVWATVPCPPSSCKSDHQCDDKNECTVDRCQRETGKCYHTALSDVSCNSTSRCQTSTCVLGSCVRSGPKCNDKNPCTQDVCDEKTGACSFPPVTAANVSCDDENPCTHSDTCHRAICLGKPVLCDDGNPCTDDICSATKGGCIHRALTGTSCDDKNACTLEDRCFHGQCTGSSFRSCNDGNPCTEDVCEGDWVSWKCVNRPLKDGASCDSLCSVGDRCLNAKCVLGQKKNCDDKNNATLDSCDEETGFCLNIPLFPASSSSSSSSFRPPSSSPTAPASTSLPTTKNADPSSTTSTPTTTARNNPQISTTATLGALTPLPIDGPLRAASISTNLTASANSTNNNSTTSSSNSSADRLVLTIVTTVLGGIVFVLCAIVIISLIVRMINKRNNRRSSSLGPNEAKLEFINQPKIPDRESSGGHDDGKALLPETSPNFSEEDLHSSSSSSSSSTNNHQPYSSPLFMVTPAKLEEVHQEPQQQQIQPQQPSQSVIVNPTSDANRPFAFSSPPPTSNNGRPATEYGLMPRSQTALPGYVQVSMSTEGEINISGLASPRTATESFSSSPNAAPLIVAAALPLVQYQERKEAEAPTETLFPSEDLHSARPLSSMDEPQPIFTTASSVPRFDSVPSQPAFVEVFVDSDGRIDIAGLSTPRFTPVSATVTESPVDPVTAFPVAVLAPSSISQSVGAEPKAEEPTTICERIPVTENHVVPSIPVPLLTSSPPSPPPASPPLSPPRSLSLNSLPTAPSVLTLASAPLPVALDSLPPPPPPPPLSPSSSPRKTFRKNSDIALSASAPGPNIDLQSEISSVKLKTTVRHERKNSSTSELENALSSILETRRRSMVDLGEAEDEKDWN